jgi:hypothetical protein
MADRVPWPRKTGGTWDLTTLSTGSPPFIVRSREYRSDNIDVRPTRENRIMQNLYGSNILIDVCHPPDDRKI